MIKTVVAVMATTLTEAHRVIVAVTVHAIAHVIVTADLLKDAVKRKGG
jgi:hypothetical protein